MENNTHLKTDPVYQKKICIIGAGPCGLTSIKNLKAQGFKNITAFEKNQSPGGNWIFDENNTHSSIYESTHLISSKKLSSFDDFPMPAHYPDYPSHRQVLDYFNAYIAQFDLLPFIHFSTEVKKVQPLDNDTWQVTYEDEKKTLHQRIFDAVLVANGHHWDPVHPHYPGHFSGEILHAHDYKKSDLFKDKKILIVGGGNSACDIAVDIARVASKTHISMRKGQHIFPKFIFGKPTDVLFSKIKWMPQWSKQYLASIVIRLIQGRYAKYHLKKPESKPLAIHPTVNSELLYTIRHGKIMPKSGIEAFHDKTVIFDNGEVETFDTIIFATGYKISFPFFDKELIDFSDSVDIPLYQKMIHPSFNNLYFIVLFQPQGCIWPLADHQAKIVGHIISEHIKRPKALQKKIKQELFLQRRYYKKSLRHSLEVDYYLFRKSLLRDLKKLKKTKTF